MKPSAKSVVLSTYFTDRNSVWNWRRIMLQFAFCYNNSWKILIILRLKRIVWKKQNPSDYFIILWISTNYSKDYSAVVVFVQAVCSKRGNFSYLVRDKKSSSFDSKKGKNLGKIGESWFSNMENDSASLHRLMTLLIVELSKYLLTYLSITLIWRFCQKKT